MTQTPSYHQNVFELWTAGVEVKNIISYELILLVGRSEGWLPLLELTNRRFCREI